MQISPRLYHWLVRPKWFTDVYIHRHIRDEFDFKGKRTLDFGSGTGDNCFLCEPGHYIGIDPDAKRIAFASRKFPGYQFNVFDGKTFPVEDNSLDYVLIVAVMHHIPSELLSSYIKEFTKILKPDGRAIVMEPCLVDKTPVRNRLMQYIDRGDYIRGIPEYLQFFEQDDYECNVIRSFKKGPIYNEVFFSAQKSGQKKRVH